MKDKKQKKLVSKWVRNKNGHLVLVWEIIYVS